MVRYTAELDRVDVSDGLRVPRREIEEAGAERRPRPVRALRGGLRPHPGLPRARGHAARRPGRRAASRVRHLTRAGGAGRHLRARWAGPLPLDRAHVRGAGPGGRRRELALCVPPAADGRVDAATLCAAAIAGVDEVYRVGGAQAIAAMAYGTRSVPAGRRDRRPGQRLRGRGQAPGLGRRRRGLGLRRAVRDRRRRRPGRARRRSPPSTWSCRPSTGPTGWPGWSTLGRDLAEEVSAEVDRIVDASSRRADLEATLATAGIACLVDGPEQALAVANAIAPEHLQLMVPDEEGLALLDLVQNAGAVFIGTGRRPAWATTSRGPTTCCRPTARRASPRRCASTTSASTCTWCG